MAIILELPSTRHQQPVAMATASKRLSTAPGDFGGPDFHHNIVVVKNRASTNSQGRKREGTPESGLLNMYSAPPHIFPGHGDSGAVLMHFVEGLINHVR